MEAMQTANEQHLAELEARGLVDLTETEVLDEIEDTAELVKCLATAIRDCSECGDSGLADVQRERLQEAMKKLNLLTSF